MGPGTALYESRKGRATERSKDHPERAESDTASVGQESHHSELSDSVIGEAMVELRKWLKENDVENPSVSQMGAHLLVQLKKSDNNMSRYMKRMLAEPDPGTKKERQRSVLPLPCLVDSRKAVNEVNQDP